MQSNQTRSENRSEAAAPDAALPDWRMVCTTIMRSAADHEARVAWSLGPEAPLPFDHRWEHVLEVVRLAVWLARETGADPEVVEAAAWLHDVRKLAPDHSSAGAEAALEILPGTNFPACKIDRVAQAIRVHEGLTRPPGAAPLDPLEAAVLWDADKLSKLGVQALFYGLSTHHAAGKSLHARRSDFDRFATRTLARTAASMNTAPAQRLATQRQDRMRRVLSWWREEETLTEQDSS